MPEKLTKQELVYMVKLLLKVIEEFTYEDKPGVFKSGKFEDQVGDLSAEQIGAIYYARDITESEK